MKIIKKIIFFIILVSIITVTVLFFSGYKLYKNKLEEINFLEQIETIRSSEYFTKKEDMATQYVDAVLAAEDHRFYDHGPIDVIAIIRAIYTNIKELDFVEGGSTITQQVAKNVFFTGEETATRKIAEMFMAYKLEKNYSKDDIFEIYVNTSYFGSGYYSIKEASEGYYDKEPKELTLSEAAMLAGIPNAPGVYDLNVNPDLAKQRQKIVINKMIRHGYLTEEEAKI